MHTPAGSQQYGKAGLVKCAQAGSPPQGPQVCVLDSQREAAGSGQSALTRHCTQAPVAHTPVGQAVPSAAMAWVQAPAEQASAVHGFPSLQLAHAPPALPHIAVAVPATHAPPLVQPVHACVQAPPVHASVV